jgi:hypothetical protein
MRSAKIPTAARVNVADMVSAKIRHSPCTIRRPMPVAGGRSHIATLARLNGNNSNQSARAAAPEVRLPHRYASSRAPPGPSVAPYSVRGRKKPASPSPATWRISGRSSISSAGEPDTPCTRSSVGVMSRSTGRSVVGSVFHETAGSRGAPWAGRRSVGGSGAWVADGVTPSTNCSVDMAAP